MRKLIISLMICLFLIGIISSSPLINIDSPANDTIYSTSSLDLNFSINESIDWCAYSLDSGANNTDIFYSFWADWVGSSISAGFTWATKVQVRPDVFYKDGTWYLIAGERYGTFKGYNWTGSTWQTDTGIIEGLVDVGDYSSSLVFEMNNTWYMIAGSNAGYNWTGNNWTSDSGITDGLGGSNNYWTPEIFVWNGTYHLVNGGYTGFGGYTWNGTYWVSDGTILSGLVSDAYNHIEFFELDDTWYAINTGQSQNFDGYVWNGSTWLVDTEIDDGLSTTSQVYGMTNFFKDGVQYLIWVRYNGENVYGHQKVFTSEPLNTTLTSLSEEGHDVIISCNNTNGDFGFATSNFEVDTTNPDIEYTTGTATNNSIIYNRDYIFVNVSVTELNEDTITFYLLDSDGSPLSVDSYTDGTRELTWTSLSDGTYKYYVKVNDTTIHNNQTFQRTIIIFNQPQDFYPLFTGEIISSGNIYNLMRSMGAGLGKFFEYLTFSLPVLLFGLVMVVIVASIGFAIAHIFKRIKLREEE